MTVLHGLATRLRLARLGLVSDTRGGGPDWEEFCRAVFSGGVNLIIIDEPELGEEALAEAVATGLRAGFSRGGIVGVSRAQVPGFGVDLLHLATREDLTWSPEQFPLVGRPAQSGADLDRWLADPALAYVSVGPVFDRSDLDPRRGPDLIRAAADIAPVADPEATPWFATGGVAEANLESVLEAGARRVLVRRAITGAANAYAAARQWADRLRKVWHDDVTLKGYARTVQSLDQGAR